MKNRNFYQVPNRFIDGGYAKKIGGHSLAVYNVILKHADRKGRTKLKNLTIAEALGISEREVRRSTSAMTKFKIVTKQSRGRFNEYTLISEDEWKPIT